MNNKVTVDEGTVAILKSRVIIAKEGIKSIFFQFDEVCLPFVFVEIIAYTMQLVRVAKFM